MPQASDIKSAVSPGRQVALDHLSSCARRYPAIFPDGSLTTQLDPRDAALAAAITRESLARWITLRTIIEPMLGQPWDRQHPAVIAALIGGATQLLLLDRIPDHAVINEAVNWCKSTPARRAAGVVNAVLRRIIALRGECCEVGDWAAANHLIRRDGSAWILNEPVFASEDQLTHIGLQSGCGRMLLARWTDVHGAEEASLIAARSIALPPVILHGASEHPDLAPHDFAGCSVLQQGGDLASTLATHNAAQVQDPTSVEAVHVTAHANPTRILDYCAGHGTKTKMLATLHPDAEVFAHEIDADRMRSLSTLASQHDRMEVVSDMMPLAGSIDLLVLDVPCTNSGVLARRVEARHRQSDRFRQPLIETQRQIAANALAALRPGGMVLWSTCSIDPAENDDQVAWLKQWHGFEVLETRSTTGHGSPSGPARMWRDGGYAALLKSPSSAT